MTKLSRKKKIFFLIIILFCSFSYSLFSPITATDTNTLLHFVQLADVHIDYPSVNPFHGKLLDDSGRMFHIAIDEINKIPGLDFVLVTGDLVEKPDEKLIKKFIDISKSLRYPYYVLLGNHDINFSHLIKKEEFIKKFYTLDNATSFTNQMSYYSFSPNEKFKIICLDGVIEKLDSANGDIGNTQLEWLTNELETNKDKYVIIALHFPIIPPYEGSEKEILEPSRTKLLDLVNGYKNVVGVFSGHYHAAGLYNVKNKIHNSCPALVQYPNAFREIIVSQNDPQHITFNFKWHQIDAPKLVHESKITTAPYRLFQGRKIDRENSFDLIVK